MANNNWMAGLDDTRDLTKICIPGSHDACMYVLKPGDPRWRVDAAITQFYRIRRQLDDGCRFFDIRVYKDGGTLRAGHFQSKSKAQAGRGSFGPPFIDVCTDIRDFLLANDREVVILKVSLADDAVDDGIRMIGTTLRDVLFETDRIRPLASHTLGALRGKVIATFDKVLGNTSVKKKLHLAKKETPKASGYRADVAKQRRSPLYLNGNAPTADSIKSVLSKQNDAREKDVKKNLAPHMQMFYLTITAAISTAIGAGGFGIASSKQKMCIADNTAREIGLTGVTANPSHPDQCKYSHWAPGVGDAYKHKIDQAKVMGLPINIVMYDFVNAEFNDVIIARN